MTSPEHLLAQVRFELSSNPGAPRPDEFERLIRRDPLLIADDRAVSALGAQIRAEITGAGPLEPLLALDGVTDVLVNGPDSVWIDRGSGLERTSVHLADEAAVRRLAQRLAVCAGRRLDDSSPFVDVGLPDGTRLHAVLPPIVPFTVISLRVLTRRILSFDMLAAAGAIEPLGAQLLEGMLRARLSFIVSGGTGSGKTTLLAALLSRVGPAERLVVIEDAPELAIQHPHVVRMVSRTANIENAGAIGTAELVRHALRMRPDRIVVGEFRGAEIVPLLTALNTGHDGSAATVHANSVADVPARLEALAGLGGLGRPELHSQLRAALDVIVHTRRRHDGTRHVAEIGLLEAALDGHGFVRPALVWTADNGFGPAAARFASLLIERGVVPPPECHYAVGSFS
jgi:pilus assembly protein CpaF